MNTTYDNFLHSKIEVAPVSGFQVPEEDLNPALKPHQKDAVLWAVKGGRRALFESFGLGKTVQELEWCRLVAQHEGGFFMPWHRQTEKFLFLILGNLSEFLYTLNGFPLAIFVQRVKQRN